MSKAELAILGDDGKDLSMWTVEKLKSELAKAISVTADGMLWMAQLWVEIEKRGEDMSGLGIVLPRYMPKVAARLLAPESVIAFYGREDLLDGMIGMKLADQRKLSAGQAIEVVSETDPKTTTSHSLKDVPDRIIARVVSSGRIRTPEEQRLAIRKMIPKRRETPEVRLIRPGYNDETGIFNISNSKCKWTDALSVVAAVMGPEKIPALDVPEEYVVGDRPRYPKGPEYPAFQKRCKDAGKPEWEMIRTALRICGLI